MYNIEIVDINNSKLILKVREFLKTFNLSFDQYIDYTIIIYQNNDIIATASKSKNVLKSFAIDENYQGLGITNKLIKNIEDKMFEEGIYHFFIYTPSYNKDIFKSVGYDEIITSSNITLLENGNRNIDYYLNNLKKNYFVSNNEKASIVMNCNPFTLGHLFLITKASKENDEVLVFVVNEDQSLFPFEDRFRLICEGTKHLKNVIVLETGPYLVSNLTFPTYFLKEEDKIISIQTKMDCEIFGNYYKRIFNINKRYIGKEPYCKVTNMYNHMMIETLPKYNIEVIEIERLENNNGFISASKVREYIKNDQLDMIKEVVPNSTYEFLLTEKGKKISSRIKSSTTRH